jgi:septin family protein
MLIPNERILVVGSKNSGKTTFINLFQKLVKSHKSTNYYSMMEINDEINEVMKKPTKIIVICDITCHNSIEQIYEHYIPYYKDLYGVNIPLIIFVNKIEKCSYNTPTEENVRILKQKIANFNGMNYVNYADLYTLHDFKSVLFNKAKNTIIRMYFSNILARINI